MKTFETFSHIAREEKSNKDLTKLPENFLLDIKEFMWELSKRVPDSVPYSTALKGERCNWEFENTVMVLNDIFKIRAQKILTYVQTFCDSGKYPINLLDIEKEIFDDTTKLLLYFKDKVSDVIIPKIQIPCTAVKTIAYLDKMKSTKDEEFDQRFIESPTYKKIYDIVQVLVNEVRILKKGANFYRPRLLKEHQAWDDLENKLLLSYVDKGFTIEKMSEQLQRTPLAIIYQLNRIGKGKVLVQIQEIIKQYENKEEAQP